MSNIVLDFRHNYVRGEQLQAQEAVYQYDTGRILEAYVPETASTFFVHVGFSNDAELSIITTDSVAADTEEGGYQILATIPDSIMAAKYGTLCIYIVASDGEDQIVTTYEGAVPVRYKAAAEDYVVPDEEATSIIERATLAATAAEAAQTAAESAQDAAETAAENAMASTPEGYADLVQTVSSLNEDLTEIDTRVTALEQGGGTIEEKTVTGGSVVTITDGAGGESVTALTVNVAFTQSGSGDPSPSNVRPIVGYTGANIHVSPTLEVADATTYSMNWTDAGTIYHGVLNVVTGTLTPDWVCRKIKDFSSVAKSTGTTSPWDHRFVLTHWVSGQTWEKADGLTNFVSDVFTVTTDVNSTVNFTILGKSDGTQMWVYDDTVDTVEEFLEAYGEHYVAYETKDVFHVPIQLTPADVKTLLGRNYIWTDVGDIASLTYSAWIPDDDETVTIDTTLSVEGDAADAKAAGDAIDAVDTKVEAIRTATSDDVGKALKVKTVANSKVTEWEFGDADAFGTAVDLATTGFYWHAATIGKSTESQLHQSTNSVGICGMVTLTAGSVLRLTSTEVNTDGSTKLFYTYNASTGILIDMADKFDMGVYKTYFLRYDVDTHIYINAKASNSYSVNMADATNPLSNIADLVGTTRRSVMELNGAEQVSMVVKNMKRPQYQASNTPTVFLHFSDIHGDAENLERIIEFASDDAVSGQIDNIICSGDIVFFSLDDTMDFYNGVSGSEDILVAVGNHDAIHYIGSTSAATALESYTALMADNISGWDVTQPTDAATNGLCYYYKDYADNNLRVIFLDSMNHGDNSYITAEVTWLADVLSDAITNDLSVMCVQHYQFKAGTFSYVDCSFSPRYDFPIPAGYIPEGFVSAVEDFITGGGDFVCWIGAHMHQDYVMLNTNGHQLCVGIACGIHNNSTNNAFSDLIRENYKKSQDLFNLISVDTTSKNISIYRVGADLTRLMNTRKHLCLDYSTRTVIWND